MDAPVAADPTFIFWGRLAAQKNLARAVTFFHQIWRARPDARFTVIGPDSGELAGLRSQCAALGIADSVQFTGALEFSDIQNKASQHTFYLQTSDYEGMAMAVVESMQFGLVPVVTPVGEIGSYCRPGHNAIIVDDDEKTAGHVLGLLEDAETYQLLRANAVRTWRDKPLYRNAMLAECLRLTAQSSSRPVKGD
jgi:glycosyltransferase involved in cell wall biosynthesis